MKHFTQQTIQDLEFDRVRERLAEFCTCPTARERMEQLLPMSKDSVVMLELSRTRELLRIRHEEDGFPRLAFEELAEDLKVLPVKDAVLAQEGFIRIYDASATTNDLLHFFNKREEDFPALWSLFGNVYHTTDIVDAVERVFDIRGEVKDDASELLREIRQRKASLLRQINRTFDREIAKLQKQGVLSDMREGFLNNRRVLSVVSTYKRQINGIVHGSSKTGTLTYIEPQSTIPLNNELEQTIEEERQEVFRILKELTSELAQHIDLITAYNVLLIEFDCINAKTKFASLIGGEMPGISLDETQMALINAYHPLLLLKNQELGKKTFPQTLGMDKFSRILVISGPNAGGKSITLKTVGLLQVMLQSGLLVPVDSNSTMCLFQQVLTDIGDNQSIENQLSTYSYRLQRMKHFLEVANKRSLLLLDEFGTGSDPDLGGALAEVFFETLYNRKCFGVITTHYANIKLKAERLRNAVNACMLFDQKTLEPLYQLSLGQPGSSFTFEVAQINGIPQELIEDAKMRVDGRKVEMDNLLASLQNEKSQLQKLNKSSQKAEAEAELARERFEEKKDHFDERLRKQQELIAENNTDLNRGRKMTKFINRFKLPPTSGKKPKTAAQLNKPLLQEVEQFLVIEKTKLDEAHKAEELRAKAEAEAARKRKAKKAQKLKPDPKRDKIKKGSVVKLEKTKQTGTVEKVDGDQITVAFNFMKMTVERNKLAFVR